MMTSLRNKKLNIDYYEEESFGSSFFSFRGLYILLYREGRYDYEDHKILTQVDTDNYHLGFDYVDLEEYI